MVSVYVLAEEALALEALVLGELGLLLPHAARTMTDAAPRATPAMARRRRPNQDSGRTDRLFNWFLRPVGGACRRGSRRLGSRWLGRPRRTARSGRCRTPRNAAGPPAAGRPAVPGRPRLRPGCR